MKGNQMPNFIINMSKFEKIFWATILLLFGITASLHLLKPNIQPLKERPAKEAIIQGFIDNKDVINKNLATELEAINNTIEQVANNLINVDNVDKFLDFHYSVAGEYVELGMGAIGKIQQTISNKLFGKDFKKKEQIALNTINQQFKISIAKHSAFISSLTLKNIDPILNQKALQKLKNDIEYRQNIQIGKAGIAVASLVSIIVAKTSLKIAKSAAIKLTVKTAGKVAAKGGLSAAVAAVGIFCGPLVFVCSSSLAIIAWFGSDYIIVKLDERWHREELKQEIISLINSSKDSFIQQYSQHYTTTLKSFSQEVKKIYINSDIKIKDRIKLNNSKK